MSGKTNFLGEEMKLWDESHNSRRMIKRSDRWPDLTLNQNHLTYFIE